MRYTLKQMKSEFPNDDVCLEFLFEAKYGNMKACRACGTLNPKYYRIKKRMAFECKDCKHQIYPLVGTIFEKTTTPLTDWFHCLYLFSVSKNGIGAKEIQRQVGVTYKTAHRMARQIRRLMQEGGKLGFLGAPIEVDEAYIGKSRRINMPDTKTPILAAVEVGRQVRTAVIVKAHLKQ